MTDYKRRHPTKAELDYENERLLTALLRYRYAVAWAAADAWDQKGETRKRFEWARANDERAALSDDEMAMIGQEYLRQSR